MPIAAGHVLRDNIRLLRPLNEGGMGTLWLAEHLGLHTQVVVKFIHAELARHHTVGERFKREAAAAAQLKSPHVVQVFDYGLTSDGVQFIVMEKLDGESLAERIERGAILSFAELIALAEQLASALDRAHRARIVHRDIKPANVFLLAGEGRIFSKVLDFGIAKQLDGGPDVRLTQTEHLVGSPAYMSPERILSPGSADPASDFWSLAVLVYEAVSGHLPFDGTSIGKMCVAICNGDMTPVSQVVPALGPLGDAFFARAFHRDAEKRFACGDDFVDALKRVGGEVQHATSPHVVVRPRASGRGTFDATSKVLDDTILSASELRMPRYSRHLVVKVALGALAVGTVAGVALVVGGQDPAPRPALPAASAPTIPEPPVTAPVRVDSTATSAPSLPAPSSSATPPSTPSSSVLRRRRARPHSRKKIFRPEDELGF